MISERSKDCPDVISCPPMLYFGWFGVGLALEWLVPLQSYACESTHIAGGILGFMGTALGLWGVHTFHRAGTYVRPNRPVTALVTNGPFRYSRNPLYVAMTVIYLGMTLSTGSWWPLAALLPALAMVHWRIILREEQFLENRFGESYRSYKTRVRRWV
ncbi:MAG TPA: isoprenylcysteine carboxylmethyltransferase family protein [Verrucomicrobiae bacterium]|nr:isoprenylcysteine carboxylmethyltransferase family protein [Verrucomicrobiae bacterium]